MKSQKFSLVLSGASELTTELADALYEATNGDIELNMRDGIVWLECTRKGESLRDTVLAIIAAVESAGVGVRAVRVESDTANTIAKINANLLQSVAAD